MGFTGAPTPAPRFSDLAAAPETGEHDPKRACATLSDRSTTLGRDFVLLVLSAGSDLLAPRALLEPAPGDGQSAMMVTVSPRHMFSSYASMLQDFRGEIIFVADRSGSMGGVKMAALQEALRIFLKSLPEQCYFNIYSFGSTYSSLWKQSSRYSKETLNEAMQHVSDSFHANMGGTELLSALKEAALQRMVRDGFTSQIILLTDGQVWNTGDTIGFVQDFRKESQNTVRFFALGIGDSVSHQLIEGIGRVGGGFGEVVAADSQGRWESRVLRLLKGALMSASWNFELELDDFSRTKILSNDVQAPYHIPPVHSFARQSVFFLLERKVAEELKSITLKTTTPSCQRLSVTLPVERAATPWNIMHNLAAKAVVMDLESGRSWMHAKNSAYRAGDTLDGAVRREAERLGEKYHITSKWTSFIATESEHGSESSTRIYKAQKLELTNLRMRRPLPGLHAYPRRSLASGALSEHDIMHGNMYGSSVSDNVIRQAELAPPSFPTFGSSKSVSSDSLDIGASLQTIRGPARLTKSSDCSMSSGDSSHETAVQRLPRVSPDEPDFEVRHETRTLEGDSWSYGGRRKQVAESWESSTQPCSLSDFVAAQSATGSFPPSPSFSARLARAFKQDVAKKMFALLENSNNIGVTSDTDGVYEIVYTVISIFFVREKLSESHELWELMISKAESWLAQQLDDEGLRLQLFQFLASCHSDAPNNQPPLPEIPAHRAHQLRESQRKGTIPKTDLLADGGSYLARLGSRDHVRLAPPGVSQTNTFQIFVIDDSLSMKKHWAKVVETLDTLVYIVKQRNDDSIEIHFTSSSKKHQYKNRMNLVRTMKEKRLSAFDMSLKDLRGSESLPDIYPRLKAILDKYTDRRTKRRFSSFLSLFKVKPLSIYIFTEGDLKSDVETCIANFVGSLKSQLTRYAVGIQFIQFGDNENDRQRLKDLNQSLKSAYNLKWYVK